MDNRDRQGQAQSLYQVPVQKLTNALQVLVLTLEDSFRGSDPDCSGCRENQSQRRRVLEAARELSDILRSSHS